MVGRAGTGKTHTLGTLRAVYESAGWTVIGLAPSARAARGAAGRIGDRVDDDRPAPRRATHHHATTIVVVDEAAMAGTRDLAAIIDQAIRVGAKVVLVGDHHQLPEVAAGGAFRAALDTLGDRVVELTVNRRQQHRLGTGRPRPAPPRRRPPPRSPPTTTTVVSSSPTTPTTSTPGLADWHTTHGDG